MVIFRQMSMPKIFISFMQITSLYLYIIVQYRGMNSNNTKKLHQVLKVADIN